MLCQEVQFGRAGRGGLAHTVVATISEPFADGRSNAITFPPLQQAWLKSHVKKVSKCFTFDGARHFQCRWCRAAADH